MIISLIGNDGSGKTTIAKEMERIFRKLGFNVIYKHEYEYTVARVVFKLLGKKRLAKSKKDMFIDKRRNIIYFLWPFVVWIDTFLQWCFFKCFKRKTIVLLDRYPYDHFMTFDYLRYLNRLSKWLYLHFPKPDIGFILWVDPEIAYKRKKQDHDFPLDFYISQTHRYKKLAKHLELTMVYTDTHLEESIEKILRKIIAVEYKKRNYAFLCKISLFNKHSFTSEISKVSVIVSTYKRNNELNELLTSLVQETKNIEKKLEILVVDDSEDLMAKKIVWKSRKIFKRSADVSYIHSEGNEYPSTCRNMGARFSKGDILIFIDDDNILSGNVINSITHFMENYPLVGVTGILNYDTKGNVWSVGGKVLKTPLSALVFNQTKYEPDEKFKVVDFIPNLYAIKRSCFFDGRGFDSENFPQALEEVDLALRAWERGYIVGILLKKRVHTVHTINGSKNKPSRPRRYYLRGKSRVLFYSKHFKNLLFWRSIPDISFRAAKTLFYKIPFEQKKRLILEYIRGVNEGYRIVKK